ncbi:MAG TPA: ROK family transcriptional regulator [Microbacteriaceae bacterium]
MDAVVRSDGPGATSRALRVTEKALPEHNRQHNRSLVLQTLLRSGPMSRADIARTSVLTRVTISNLVNELVADGIVKELGLRTGTHVGKPATLVDIDPDAFRIIALDLSADDRFVGALVNLRGAILERTEVDVHGKLGEDAFSLVVELCETLVSRASVRILGIGVGSPGIVDHSGVVREAPNLGWYELAIADRLSRRFGAPVHVGNDANAAALGVHSFRQTSGQSLMVITIEHGVGAGVIIGGALVEGEQCAAGEIGHVVIDEDGDLCSCGRRGCLELTLAAPHLRRRLAAAPAAEHAGILGDAGRALGIALSPVVSVLNLNDVVLAGPPEIIDGPLLEETRSTIRNRTMSAVNNGLDVRLATAGEELVLLGAAVLVLSAELGVS